ncbi:MAG: hypothetical protein WEB79_08490 [Thermoleophilaceae bacterium]
MPPALDPRHRLAATLATCLRPDEAAALRKLAADSDRTIAAEIRRAVRAHLEANRG